jgi:hypothetical protein
MNAGIDYDAGTSNRNHETGMDARLRDRAMRGIHTRREENQMYALLSDPTDADYQTRVTLEPQHPPIGGKP